MRYWTRTCGDGLTDTQRLHAFSACEHPVLYFAHEKGTLIPCVHTVTVLERRAEEALEHWHVRGEGVIG